MKNAIIPLSFFLETDDLGWDNGWDLRVSNKPSSSGVPRYHTFEDYEVLQKITEATGKHIAAAIVVGDWDKDNYLRGEVGVTYDPYGWDRAKTINVEKTKKFIDYLEKSNVDYMVHGLVHGRYDENGKQLNEQEYIVFETDENGKRVTKLPSEEDMRHRLDLFFKICNSWGMKKPFKGFVNPGSACGADDETLARMCKVLYDYGVRYWADPFYNWKDYDTVLKVCNGVAMVRWLCNPVEMPWCGIDIDPDKLSTVNGINDGEYRSPFHGSHWANFVRFNPEHNFTHIPAWKRFYDRQGEVWGSVNAETLAESINQAFYYQFAKAEETDEAYVIDCIEVENNKLDCHENRFFISFRHGFEPKGCIGGEITLHEKRGEFDTYCVVHTENTVKILK